MNIPQWNIGDHAGPQGQQRTIRNHIRPSPYGIIWDHAESYGTIADLTGPYRFIQDQSRPKQIIQDHVGPCRTLQNLTRPYGSLWVLTGPNGTLQDLTGPYWTLWDHTCYNFCKSLQYNGVANFLERTDGLTYLLTLVISRGAFAPKNAHKTLTIICQN